MGKKKNVIIATLCAAVLLMTIVYSAFKSNISIITTGNITSNWLIEITSIESQFTGEAYNISTPSYTGTNASFNAGLVKPGDKVIYTITVKNIGDIDAIIDKIDIVTEGNSEILYSISDIQSDVRLLAGEEISFQVIVEFDINVTSIPSNLYKSINMSIVCVQDQGQSLTPSDPNLDGVIVFPNYLSTQILIDNHRESDENIDFTRVSGDDNGNGLYYTSNNTEDNKVTYYFRGNVNNNFVKFGKDTSGNDLYWRIIRVNEDVSVRLIYNGTSPTATGSDVTIGTGIFNEKVSSNAFLGYMYGDIYYENINNSHELTHLNNNASTIKNYIENWYSNDTNLGDFTETHLADSGFCNDRSVSSVAALWNPSDTALGYGTHNTYYGAYNRLINEYNPKFLCTNAENDLFTTNSYAKGNKKLSIPVGLITADEISYAGGVFDYSNTDYYLYTNYSYFSMTPYGFSSAENTQIAYSFVVNDNGSISKARVDYSHGVRPVISLKPTVEITDEVPSGCTKQDGTAECPYIIKTN